MAKPEVIIWYNPRCSKCRETLSLLQEAGHEPQRVEYLTERPDKASLRRVLGQLGLPARKLLRRGEAAFKELGLADETLGEDLLIDAMVVHPELIEWPIVVAGGRAALGRPPGQVLEILADELRRST
ncbi:MAG: arsenate reductase (glutaredoxin) [Alphaproteobacteria bacterium]|nr:arsenate reductase (glutaredoxin) [Alphaproteobacteria bacterium]